MTERIHRDEYIISSMYFYALTCYTTPYMELLALTQLFASLAFDKDDIENQTWITRRFAMYRDIFRDTPAYQQILAIGLEEGLEKGLEEGLEKGLEKEQQRRLHSLRSKL